jgi:hypothetical protein
MSDTYEQERHNIKMIEQNERILFSLLMIILFVSFSLNWAPVWFAPIKN